ncbi:hypothetical protein M5K25_007485 [Dendrobium thyrsiflorum]|uniref:Uncharacterized protein n=1 Tax=Dendrobium thyrsiflorum TaxID=117978 RepID=A0ABD0VEG7_DENTH
MSSNQGPEALDEGTLNPRNQERDQISVLPPCSSSIDHRWSFAEPPSDHHLTPNFSGPSTDVVPSPDHHLRPEVTPDHHLRPEVAPDHHLTPRVIPDHHLRPVILLDHHLRPEVNSLEFHVVSSNVE